MKISSWNMENFYVLMDKYKEEDIDQLTNEEWEALSTSRTKKNKHLQKVLDASNVIKEIDAEVYVLTEIGGRDTLNNFNKHFLDDKYWYYLKEGNSKRGIEIGFYLEKKSKYKAEVFSNRNIELENGKKFSRNIAELRLSHKDKLKYIILGVHLKSKHHMDGDFEGMNQRGMELRALKNHIKELKKKYKVPVIVGGDFNCTLEEPELKEFSKGLLEFHSLKKSPIEESYTHVHFSTHKVLNQIDFLFTTKDAKINLDKSYTYRFKNEYGDVLGVPDTFEEKRWNPSDHYPLVLDIKK